MRNTKLTGDTSEAYVLAKLVGMGCSVSVPFGDNQRYDLVVEHRERKGMFARLQCKTGNLINGGDAIQFPITSQTKYRGRKGYHGEVDAFAVYCQELEEVYLFPISECEPSQTTVTLRLKPTRNGQSLRVVWAKDYVLK